MKLNLLGKNTTEPKGPEPILLFDGRGQGTAKSAWVWHVDVESPTVAETKMVWTTYYIGTNCLKNSLSYPETSFKQCNSYTQHWESRLTTAWKSVRNATGTHDSVNFDRRLCSGRVVKLLTVNILSGRWKQMMPSCLPTRLPFTADSKLVEAPDQKDSN